MHAFKYESFRYFLESFLLTFSFLLSTCGVVYRIRHNIIITTSEPKPPQPPPSTTTTPTISTPPSPPKLTACLIFVATLGRVELRTGRIPGVMDHSLNPWTTRSDIDQSTLLASPFPRNNRCNPLPNSIFSSPYRQHQQIYLNTLSGMASPS